LFVSFSFLQLFCTVLTIFFACLLKICRRSNKIIIITIKREGANTKENKKKI